MNDKSSASHGRNSRLKLQLNPDVSIDLRAEAKRRGVEYDDLAAGILDAVVKHELYAAVLDH